MNFNLSSTDKKRLRRVRRATKFWRQIGWETLEPRTLMFGDTAAIATTTPVWQYAWDNAADLSQYSSGQLNNVREWAVRFDPNQRIESTLAGELQPVVGIPEAYVWQVPESIPAGNAAAVLSSRTDVLSFYPLVAAQQIARTLPNDPMIGQQWHLKNTGQSGGAPGRDANVEPAWDAGVRGDGVVIGIVDDGLQYTHPDLAPNYSAENSFDFNFNDSDPTPYSTDGHGTSAGGVAAARGGNALGVAGAAYNATLAGLRLIAAGTSDSQEANALSYRAQDIDIYSNSWGPADNGATLEAPGALTLAAMQNSVTTGRGGLGSIYVWAAGNGLQSSDNANYDGYASSRYVIGVSAIGHSGFQSTYSEPGASILVAGYSSDPGITTTDLVGFSGYSSTDYTSSFGGTSSATPLVAGVVALMLQANPNLTWRDVREVLARSAAKNDPFGSSWVVNGGGHDVSHNYGFGAIDASAAVNLAKIWNTVSPEVSYSSAVQTANLAIPDSNSVGVTSTINVPAAGNLRVQAVEVVFNASHAYRGDLEVVLTSPSGTQSVLAQRHGDSGANYTNWVFSSTHHLDEMSVGNWTLTVRDLDAGITGTFQNWTLRLYGTPGGFDYGDLPASYELAASAKHGQLTGLSLGAAKDVESTPAAPLDGTGDGGDDDGVVLPVAINRNGGVYSYVANVTGRVGKLDAWIDFNADGDFADAGEKIANSVAVGTGDNILSFTAPSGIIASSLNARFRLSTSGGLSFVGTAVDGEIEDYSIPTTTLDSLSAVIVGNQLTITDTLGRDNNLSISRNGNELTIVDTNESFIAVPPGGVLSNSNKTLTIDLNLTPLAGVNVIADAGNDVFTTVLNGDNPIPSGGLTYDGGNSIFDQFLVSGSGNVGAANFTLNNANSGVATLSNYGMITVSGVKYIVHQTQGTDVNINLPAGANTITLGDDGVSGNNRSRLTGNNVPHLEFRDPTGAVTILPGSANDAMTVNSAADADADVAFGSAANPFATLTIAGLLDLATGNYFQAFANSVQFSGSGSLSTTGNGGIGITTNSVDINTTATITAAAAGQISIQPLTSGRGTNVGGADSGAELGLTDLELDRLTAGTIQIGNSVDSGPIRMTAAITRPTNSAAVLTFAAGSGFATQFPVTGTDLALAAGTVSFVTGTDVQFAINGATAGTLYEQLVVTGGVQLSGADLVLTGSYQPGSSDSFTLIDNDGVDSVEGVFNGLPEGTLLTINGGTNVVRISYLGGTGNDVVLLPANVTIGGRVWQDANSNGLQDGGETGVAGAVAELFDSLGNSKGIQITDSAGGYQFRVGPGSYQVEYRLPMGFALTTANVGGNDALDSDPSTSTSRTGLFTVAASSTNLTWDAGATGGPPGFGWVTNAGSIYGSYSGNSVVRDWNGNIYSGGVQANSSQQGVITKQTSVGARIWQAPFFPRNFGNAASVSQIELAPNGDLIAIGLFTGTVDFDPGSGTMELTSFSSSNDVFVVRLNSDGKLIWARQFGGSGTRSDVGVAVDADGNAYAMISFTGTIDADPGIGVDNRTPFPDNGVLIEKLDTAGNRVWVNFYGDRVNGRDITVSPAGLLVFGGDVTTSASDFDPGPGTAYVPQYSVYVAKVNLNGEFVSLTYPTMSSSSSRLHSLAVGADDSIVASMNSSTSITVDFDPGPATYSVSGTTFLWKLDANNNLQWAQGFTADFSGLVVSTDIALDSADNVYVTGMFTGRLDFDPGPAVRRRTAFSANGDAFVAQYSAAGAFVNAMFLVSTNSSFISSTALALVAGPSAGDVTLVGQLPAPTDFDPGVTQFNVNPSGSYANSFVASYHLPYNSAPTISTSTLPSLLLEDTTSAAISIGISDLETDANLLTLSASSTNPTLFPASGFVFSGTTENRTLRITPGSNQTGSGSITITVTDAEGATASRTFSLIIAAVNDPPSFVAGPDQTVLMNVGSVSVPNWATAISPGPANEAAQAISFLVETNSNTALFLAQPSVSSNGTLTFEPMPNVTGTATLTLRVYDSGGTISGGVNNSPPQTFTITVNPQLSPPTITEIADQTILEDGSVVLNFTISDAETADTALTLFATSTNSSLLPAANIVWGGSGANRTVTITPTADQHGSSVVAFYVRDESGETAADIINLTVTGVNDAPSFTKGPDQNIYYSTTTQSIANWATAISPGPTNENTQALTFQIVGNTDPAFFAVAPAISPTGTLTYTKAANAFGSVTLSVQLVDNGGTDNGGIDTSPVQTFTINVDPDVTAPSLTAAIGNQTINEDSSTSVLTFTIGDDVTAAGSLLVSAVSSDQGLIPTANLLLGGSGADRTLQVIPMANNFGGPATITVTVQDAAFNKTQFSFAVTVLSVNDRPTFVKGADVTVNEDGVGNFPVWATSISRGPNFNEGWQTLTFNTTVVSNASMFAVLPAISSSGTLTFTPAANANGTANVSVTLSDNGGVDNGGLDTSVTQTFTITINSVNDAPSFTKGADVTVNEDAGAQSFNAWGTNIIAGPANESAQTVAFSVSNTNSALFAVAPALTSTGTLTFTPAANQFGTSTVTVTLTDNGGTANGGVSTSASQTFVITVNSVNDRPTFTPGSDVAVNEDAFSQFTSWASNPLSGASNETSSTFTYTVTNTNPSLFSVQPTISSSGYLDYRPAANANGSAQVTVTLNDGDGTANGGIDTSLPVTFTITVNPVNDRPTFTIGSSVTVLEDAGPQTFTNWISVFSPGPANEAGQSTTFNITGVNASFYAVPPAIDPVTGTLTFTPALNANGSDSINVTISDNGGTLNGGLNTSTSQSFTITITGVNDAPVVNPTNFTSNEEASVFSLWSTPDDGASNEFDSLTFAITNNSNPGLFSSGPTINSLGYLSYTPVNNAFGTATITATLTDSGGTANGGVNTTGPFMFDIIVSPVNDPPSFTSGSNQTVNEDTGPQTVANWATAINAGPANESTQVLLFSIASISNPSLFSAGPALSSNGTLTYTLAPNANGSGTVRFRLTDDGGTANGAVDSFLGSLITFTVNSVNDAPSFTKGADVTVNEDAGAQSLPAWATAISPGPTNESGQTVSFIVTDNNPSLFSVAPAIAANGTLTFTPAANAFGTATISVQAQDNGGVTNGGINVSAVQTFVINVMPMNDPPSFTATADPLLLEDAGPQTILAWATAMTAGPSNESGQLLTFEVVDNSNPGLFSVTPAIAADGTLTFTPAPNAFGTAIVTVQLRDDGGAANGGSDVSSPVSFAVNVDPINDVPTFTKGSNQTAFNNSGPQTVAVWATSISSGPNESQSLTFNVTNNTNSALFSVPPAIAADGTLTYTPAPGAEGTAAISVALRDNGGTANSGVDTSPEQTFTISIAGPTLTASSPTTSPSSFNIRFNRPIKTSVFNLADANSLLGASDITVTGATTGNVRGSIVLDTDARGFRFIKSGSAFAADTYTVMLRSAANGFTSQADELLDGNGDGTAGDNYVQTFTVASSPLNAVTVSVNDFIRGYGQVVNVPANGTAGIPITLSTGVNVAAATIHLQYNPALLTITGGTSPLAGVTTLIDASTPGIVVITATSGSQFTSNAGTITLANLTASVPISATYAAKNLLDITVVSLTDTAATAIPAVADDGLHVVSYRGDLNGDRNIGPGDATLALRLQSGVLGTTGFTAFQQVDPYLASDMNDDGTATPGDITGLLRFQSGAAGGFNRIPALPVGLTPPITYAADPQIFIPTELSAQPSEVVSVPIRINVTDPQGIDLAGVAVTFAYDPLQFSVSNVRLGDTLAAKGFAASFNTAVPGLVQLITATDVGPALATGYIGDLFVFDLTVNANATAGSFSLNLLSATNATDNNSNNLLLAPAIQDDWDVNDGVITVMANAKAIRSDINGDGTVDIDDIVAAIFYLNNSFGVDLSLATAAVKRANVVLDSQLDIRDILTVIYDYNAKDQGTGEAAAASSDPNHHDVVPDEESIDVLDLIAADLVLNRKKRG